MQKSVSKRKEREKMGHKSNICRQKLKQFRGIKFIRKLEQLKKSSECNPVDYLKGTC